MLNNPLGFIRLLLLSFLVGACTSTSTSESTGQYLDSTALTTKVKASLVDDLGSQGFAIQVKTFKGEVQLSGFVDNQMIKQRSERIASGVDGVIRVRNSILIK